MGIKAGIAVSLLALTAFAGNLAQADTLEDLKKKGSVRVAVAIEPPYTIMDTDGNLSGAVPDVARAALKRMGIGEIEVQVTDWGALIPGLQARRFDMIATGLYIREDRCEAILFSEPDTCSGDVFVHKSDMKNPPSSYAEIAANPDIKIAIAGGSSYEKDALAAGISQSQIVTMSDVQGGLDLVESGRANVLAAPDLSSRAAVEEAGAANIVLNEIEGSPARCGAPGFHKDDQSFRDAFDAALLQVKESGEYAEIVGKYGFNAQLASVAKRADYCPAN